MNLFGKNLPKSLRESIEGFVGSNKDEFRRENTSRIITTPLPDGGFDATLHSLKTGMRYLKSASSSRMQSIRVLRRKIGRLRIKKYI